MKLDIEINLDSLPANPSAELAEILASIADQVRDDEPIQLPVWSGSERVGTWSIAEE